MPTAKSFRKRLKRFFKPKPDTRVAVWEQHKLLYVRIPKCGNTSVLRAIEGAEPRYAWGHDIAAMDDTWTTFSFVRNPWARIVSAYLDKVRGDSGSEHRESGVYRGFLTAGMPVRPGMGFAEFCEVVCAIEDARLDRHLRSQASVLVRDGKPIVQIVGRVETMARDWQTVMVAAGLAFPLPHLNRASSQHYSTLYDDPRLVDLVGDRYAEDVRLFGYDFENPATGSVPLMASAADSPQRSVELG